MICKKCSFNNADGAVFCTQCGTKLSREESVTVVSTFSSQRSQDVSLQPPINEKINAQPNVGASSAPVFTSPAPVYPSYGSTPTTPAHDRGSIIIGETKKIACSPLMIVAAVALTISTLFSFISYFANFDWWKSFFGSMLYPFVNEIDNFSLDDFEMFAAVIGGIFVVVSTSLIETGIWSTITHAFSPSPQFNTSGLSSIKSAHKMFVTLAYCSIGYISFLFIKILIHIAEMTENGYSYPDDVMGIMFSLIFILVLCAVFYIVVYSSANRSLSMCDNAMKNNGSQFYASPALGVLLIGIAFLYLICLLVPNDSSLYDLHVFNHLGVAEITLPSVFATCIGMFKIDVFSTLAAFFFAVSAVCFAIVIFVQRSKMTRLYYESKYSHY